MTESEVRDLIASRLREKMAGKPLTVDNVTQALTEIGEEYTHVVQPKPEVTVVPGSQRIEFKLFPAQVIGLPIGPKN